eukprot:TRINITY_DN44948_c0_g1_i1.p1 TRINITY_DN44948_c0_g1~~TRINITY_DN44948_c0_g1_i1.p1  ORF type:complete len:288 (+),score=18.59 TRINITY_DN44948_c0_g1_i1:58-864(+)
MRLPQKYQRLFSKSMYQRWHNLQSEASHDRASFRQRACVQRHLLRHSQNEDLRRTLEGSVKDHRADSRSMFGVSDSAERASDVDWGDVSWVINDYKELKELLLRLLEMELVSICANGQTEPFGSLGMKILSRKEAWSQSVLRHCVYPPLGTCSEHTDYGVLTIQHSNCLGLEGCIGGEWKSIPHSEDCLIVYAGDMLERLTNGRLCALLHRVCLPGSSGHVACDVEALPLARQSHIFFLQPDSETIVRPLYQFLRFDGDDLPCVRYGN